MLICIYVYINRYLSDKMARKGLKLKKQEQTGLSPPQDRPRHSNNQQEPCFHSSCIIFTLFIGSTFSETAVSFCKVNRCVTVLFSNVPFWATYGFVLLCLFCDIPSCYVLFCDVPLCDVPFCDTPFCDVPFCILTLSYTSFSAFKHLLVLSLHLSFAWSKKPSPSKK
jgi:hypothetical protein